MKLLTDQQRAQLLENGRRQAAVRGTDDEIDFAPVVKLFTPDAAATWLLTEIEPDEPDIAWGLCDLGVGCPEFGTVSLSELATVRGRLGLGVERHLSFKPDKPISAYGNEASVSAISKHDRTKESHRLPQRPVLIELHSHHARPADSLFVQ